MNYCSVTRQAPFWGVDKEVGCTSRITHTHTHTHTHTLSRAHIQILYMYSSLGHTHRKAITKLQVKPLFLSELNLWNLQYLLHYSMNTLYCTEPTQHRPNTKYSHIQCRKVLREKEKTSQTFQKCCSFSGEGSKRSVRLTLAAAWLCNANNAHPQTDPCEPSQQLHTPTPEPADLNAASVQRMTVRNWDSTVSQHRGGS